MPRFGLSATQLIATALAAVTATIAASYLGVSGTVIGAALASVVSAVGSAIYSHSLRRTHARVREVVPYRRSAGRARVPEPVVVPPALAQPRRRGDRGAPRPWLGAVLGCLAAFVTVLAVVTAVELAMGRPISDALRGGSGSGTSFFGDTHNGTQDKPTTTPTAPTTVTPHLVVTTRTITKTTAAVTKSTPATTKSTAAISTTATPTENPAAPTPSTPSGTVATP